jgi:hypothetical protein
LDNSRRLHGFRWYPPAYQNISYAGSRINLRLIFRRNIMMLASAA